MHPCPTRASAERSIHSNLGYLIHPAIAARLPTPARFADVGTGTGIFLSDLARCLPVNCRLEGFDISDAQFPSLQSLPANICLDILDAKQPFPQHLHHRYDLVCLRLLVAAVEKYEWEGITRNVRELLRPGGAIQWVEADHSQMFLSPFQGTPSATTESLQKWGTRICYGPMGDRLKYGWSTLPAIFRKLGLEDIVSEAISSDRTAKTRQDGTDVQIAVCRSIANHPRHVEGLGGRREVDRMIAEMKADQASGAFLRWTIHVAFGFKPTTEDTVPSTSRKQACLSHLSSDDRSVSRIGHYEDGYLLQIPRGSFRSLSEESSLR